MRDHPFDAGNQFNQGALTRLQIDQAENQIMQQVREANRQLKSIKLMPSPDQKIISHKIDALSTHAQEILRSIDSKVQINLVLKKTDLRFQQIIVSEQLTVVSNLVINRIYHSSLTKTQQSTAINEIKTAKRFSVEDMKNSTNDESVKIAFTTGVNAINGALAKYVADSQINAINQIERLVRQTEDWLSHKDSIPNSVRDLINQQLGMLKQHAVNDLLTSINFVQLAKTRQHYVNELKTISSDKHDIIKDLVAFTRFMRQINDVIISLTLSSDDKIQIEHQINNDRDKSINTLKRSTQIDPKYLIAVKHQITSTIINAVSHHYQYVIMTQTLMLRKDQRHDLTERIKQTAARVNKRPLEEPIKLNLIKALHQLKAVVQQRQALLYQSQIDRIVKQIQSRIDQLYDLSKVSRDYLKSQIISFSHRIKGKSGQSDFGETQQTLQRFFQGQFNFVQKLNLQRDFTSLIRQIHYSHLNKGQQQTLNHRLNTIKSNSMLNYSNQRLFIKNMLNYSLKLDRDQSEDHVRALIQQINNHLDVLTRSSLKPKFTQIKTNFEHNMANASQLITIDHQAQQAENKLSVVGYQLKNSIHSAKSQALAQLIDRTHSLINTAVLQPDLKQIINDRLDRFFNAKMVALINEVNAKTSLSEINKAVNDRLAKALTIVKQAAIWQLDDLVRSTNYQLKAFSAVNYVGKLNQMCLHATVQIKGASNLSRIEAAKQRGQQKINAFTTQIISKVDNVKAQAHQQIKKLVAITKSRLGNHAKLLISNQILMISNQANRYINRGLDSQVQARIINCQVALDDALRHSYLQTWTKLVDQAKANVLQLVRVSDNVKQRAIAQIKIISLRVIPDLKQLNGGKLALLVHTNQAKVQTIVNQASYMDPAKRKVRDRLTHLIKQTEQDAKQYQSGKVQSHTIQTIRQLDQTIDHQLSTNDDHQLQRIYQTNCNQLMTWQLKMVRQAQLKQFGKAFKQTVMQLQALRFLNNQKVRKTEAKLNRCYHKTIYDIKNAPDTQYCLHNEQLGERLLNQLITQNKSYNAHKQRIYTAILSKVSHAKHQVNDLRYVQNNDKRSSLELLKQIQQVAIHQVKKAANHEQIFTIEHRNYQAIQQVMNNVVSANVILAAIQSANDRIARSNLSSKQKDSALKQIHQIINNGLKAQTKPKSTPNVGDNDKKPATRTASDYGFTPRRAPKRHPLIELINSIRHFFRWLFGKLAREL